MNHDNDVTMKIPFVLGQLTKDVTVGHLDRPDLVWVSPPPTDESDELLQQVMAQDNEDLLDNLGTLDVLDPYVILDTCLSRWRPSS